jgi:ABC-type Mn2+/Zn2+ transport system permease subunit
VSLIEWIVQPFRYSFMVRALAASVLVGGLSAVVGSYVVLRSMAFLGDALAHSVLPGVAAGYIVAGGANRRTLFWWALGTAVAVALGIEAIGRHERIKEDTAIAIVFAGTFALGIALISTVRGFAADLVHVLFGNVLGVSTGDLLLIGLFGGAVLLIVLLFYKEFLVVSFDPTLAKTLRLPTAFYRILLLLVIAVVVVVSLQTVGLGLMLAMLITPATTAYLLTRRLPRMMLVGALFGVASGVVGLYLSFYFGLSSGAAIVLVAIGFFLVVLLARPRTGLLARALRR